MSIHYDSDASYLADIRTTDILPSTHRKSRGWLEIPRLKSHNQTWYIWSTPYAHGGQTMVLQTRCIRWKALPEWRYFWLLVRIHIAELQPAHLHDPSNWNEFQNGLHWYDWKSIILEKYSSQSQNGNWEYLYIITYFLSIIKIDVADFGYV